MLVIGYFKGIDSERGIAWRGNDLLALRQFPGIELEESGPDHSTMSRAGANWHRDAGGHGGAAFSCAVGYQRRLSGTSETAGEGSRDRLAFPFGTED